MDTKMEKTEPRDRFNLVHLCSFLLGFMSMVPFFIVSTSAGYWMYKFRDPSTGSSETNGNNRTTLQTYFQSATGIAQQLPSVLFALFWTAFGHTITPMKRTMWSLVAFIGLYVVFTVFTKIDTDSWEVEFFSIIMILLVINTALMATLQMSGVVLMAKLTPSYLMYYLVGQNGNFFVTILQIICLAVTDDQTTTGLIYFSINTIVIVMSVVLLMLSKRSEVFRYFDVENVKHQTSETLSWRETLELAKKIWPCLLIIFLSYFGATSVHPSISTLVVSQYEYKKNDWSKKYFTPVGAFLISECSAIIGRITSKYTIINNKNKWLFIVLAFVRTVTLIPIGLFLNAQPRNLPVIFDKDWEFMLYMFYFGFTLGFLMNICAMSMKVLAPGQQEQALKLMSLTISVCSVIFVANGTLTVMMLKL
ncbi:unnamed protein product [Phyllotreta striolata]|uniref:Uncharacterized protein n=1 Tax=Phyllotreta striolata TaxID=444603 RepID=A0A9N9TMG0_PHYSR|nr:unnamed protein product [Phyllotreta striolata]